MLLRKKEIEKLKTLITQYAEAIRIDNNTMKIIDIFSEIEKSKHISFDDLIFLSYKLKLSPDFITSVSETNNYDENLVSIIHDAIELNEDYKEALAEHTKSYLETQNTNSDYIGADIVVKHFVEEDGVYSLDVDYYEDYDESIEVSKVAETKKIYNKKDKN